MVGNNVKVEVFKIRCFVLGVADDLPISFHAEMPANQQVPVSSGTVIKFQNVLLDTRQSFHSDSSIFVVPVSGVYVLHWTISAYSNTRAETQLMVNAYSFLINVLYALSITIQ